MVLSGEGETDLRRLWPLQPVAPGGTADVNYEHADLRRPERISRKPVAWRDGFEAAQANATLEGRSQIAQAATALIGPNDLLTKLDRCLMSHNLEGGHPFWIAKLRITFRLPDDLKIQRAPEIPAPVVVRVPLRRGDHKRGLRYQSVNGSIDKEAR